MRPPPIPVRRMATNATDVLPEHSLALSVSNSENLPLSLEQSCAFCVLGMPRGGTTIVAKLIQNMGVFMGHDLPVTVEDPTFSRILQQTSPDPMAFRDLVSLRFSEYK